LPSLSQDVLPTDLIVEKREPPSGLLLGHRYSVRWQVCGPEKTVRALCGSAGFRRGCSFPLRGSPAAFPCFVRLMKVPALPRPRLSRASTYCGHLRLPARRRLRAFGFHPYTLPYQDGASSAGPCRVSPVNLIVLSLRAPPRYTVPAIRFHSAVLRIVQASPCRTQARPGKSSS